MHTNEKLIERLFSSLNAHDADAIAGCYLDNAIFEDIAFRLRSKKEIHAMWDMICAPTKDGKLSDIKVSVLEVSANESTGRAILCEDYTYRDNGRPVHNRIISSFEFQGGLISKQHDDCDAICWAHQALGGVSGFIAGHVGLVRRFKAMGKLKRERPEAFKR